MKILFLVYHGFSEASGISKKIRSQVKGLRENGHDVHVCYYDFSADGHRCRYVDDTVIQDYGTGLHAAIRQRYDYGCVYKYCAGNGIDLVYARSFMNATPQLARLIARLRKSGIKTVTEIPTYPYDGEFAGFPLKERIRLFVDKMFRRRLAKEMSAIVTFSDAEYIFGCKTVNISNGIDLDSIPIHECRHRDNAVHLIGVAEVHYWHGYDRLIAGLGEYYAKPGTRRNVYFHIVGGVGESEMHGSAHAPGFACIIKKYRIEKNVVFHGQLFGTELDRVFDSCVFAVGSLGRHRSGITSIKTLKNREYAARGIPFAYSECDSDFDGRRYVLKVPADESPINIGSIIEFIESHDFQPSDIRDTVSDLSWKTQMKRVIDAVNKM